MINFSVKFSQLNLILQVRHDKSAQKEGLSLHNQFDLRTYFFVLHDKIYLRGRRTLFSIKPPSALVTRWNLEVKGDQVCEWGHHGGLQGILLRNPSQVSQK